MVNYGIEVDETSKAVHDPLNRLDKRDKKKAEHVIEEKNRHEILEAGQDNRKKAIKAIEGQEKERVRGEESVKNDVLNHLDIKKRFSKSYKIELARALAQILENLDWLPGWRAQVVITDGSPISVTVRGMTRHFKTKAGLLTLVIAADGRVYHQGFRITQEPALDYMALYTVALQTENQLDREKGLLLDNLGRQVKAPQSPILDKHGRSIPANPPHAR